MALSHTQADLFLCGAWTESKSIKEGWQNIYGEEKPQNAIDALCSVIADLQEVMLEYMGERIEMEKYKFQHIERVSECVVCSKKSEDN